jgi:hypothetical protein
LPCSLFTESMLLRARFPVRLFFKLYPHTTLRWMAVDGSLGDGRS